MRPILAAILACLALGQPALADPMEGAAAKKLLFSPRGADAVAEPGSGLEPAQMAVVEAILKQMRAESAGGYYGALAVSPDFFTMLATDAGQAALSGLMQISERLHGADAAAEVALSACEAARKPDQAPCVLAARILPRRWQPRSLQISTAATEAFKAYRKGKGPKAMAVSARTVAWAIARGEGAAETAVATCNDKAAETGSPDCEVVIAD